VTLARIAVVGAGAWGSALANVAARAGCQVTLWGRDVAVIRAIIDSGESAKLPGIRLDGRVLATTEIGQIADADAVLLAVPAQALRAVAAGLAPTLGERRIAVIACAKGIERDTRLFMTEVIAQVLPQAVPGILSGPSFATDVGRGLPTAVTLAAADDALATALAHALGSATFRPYHSPDLRGVEIGGAAKNVLAIAAGIVTGRRLGASAAAALTTRGFAELARFGRAHGGRAETLTGLSGLGDLILTCSSRQSRNFSLGVALGEGASLVAARDHKLAEGVYTAAALVDMATARGVDMPISTAVAAVLEGRCTIDEAIDSLLTRPFRAEE
jgi:glycerol-3-phosphate dehydrogenase (NAD(P)+)